MRYYILSIFIILIDQLAKLFVVKNMEYGESTEIIHNFFFITSHRNEGAAWGILQGQMIFFYIITVIVIIFLVYNIQKNAKMKPFFGFILSMLLGGAIGNFIDRVFRKEVVDFFDFTFFHYNFPIFNVADMSLVIGVILFFVYTLFSNGEEKPESKNK